jgi:hypothetical protein
MAIATPVDAASKPQLVAIFPRTRTGSAPLRKLRSPADTSAALAKADDVASTRTYIRAYYALARTAKAKLPDQQTAAADLLRRISSQCPDVLAGSPRNEASAELSLEALGAVSIVMSGPDRHAITHFLHAVKGLQWSSPKLTRTVTASVARLKAQLALIVPDLCSDMKAWAATDFRTVPMSVTQFNRRTKAAEEGPQEIPSRLLASYTGRQEKVILRNIKHLEVQIEASELNTGLHAWSEILKVVGLSA